jgi:RNA polymerase sigma factor for flagellar operon FliA
VGVREVIAAVLPALTTRLHSVLEEVVVSTLTSFVVEHTAAHRAAVTSPSVSGPDPVTTQSSAVNTDGLWRWVRADRAQAALTERYGSVVAGDSLDATIAQLVADGVDGELVTWEIITRESVRHEGLIYKECNRLVRTLPDRNPDELKGYGWAGLRVALRNYNPALGFAFSTYACPKINGAIRDGVRAESPIPKRLTTFLRKVSHAEEALTQMLSRPPSYAEIADYIKVSSEAMSLLPRLTSTASLDELSTGWGETSREPSCLVDAADPEDAALTALRNAALHRAVDALPEEESVAVRLLMLEEMPVSEAAALVGVEPRQLRMRKLRGLRALAPVMRSWQPELIS